MYKSYNFQELFYGFQKTPLLWENKAIYDLEQYQSKTTNQIFIPKTKDKALRLGKWVEEFVIFQLQQQPNNIILKENLQIKKNKQTIGELDVLFSENENPVHLEIIYKFYLFKNNDASKSDLNNWVGPNLNDALVYKLEKLKHKQLPLLYHSSTKEALNHLNVDLDAFKQCVCFKVQLYLPFKNDNIDIGVLNPLCIVGFYINFEHLMALENYQFYLPQKLEWLCKPKQDVNWQSLDNVKPEINAHILQKRSPMCWLKNDTNTLQKCFITWW